MAYSKKTSTRSKKRNKRTVTQGIIHIKASFNNTLITFTDLLGNTLCNGSGGQSGFKGTQKATPFAAQMTMEKVATMARDEFGTKAVGVYIKGPGVGRDAALRGLSPIGFRVFFIKDKTRLPHGGTRPPKARRV